MPSSKRSFQPSSQTNRNLKNGSLSRPLEGQVVKGNLGVDPLINKQRGKSYIIRQTGQAIVSAKEPFGMTKRL